MVGDFNLILLIYAAIGCVIGGLMIWVPEHAHQNWLYRFGLFCLLVIAWLPLAFLSWIVIPLIKLCPCYTRH